MPIKRVNSNSSSNSGSSQYSDELKYYLKGLSAEDRTDEDKKLIEEQSGNTNSEDSGSLWDKITNWWNSDDEEEKPQEVNTKDEKPFLTYEESKKTVDDAIDADLGNKTQAIGKLNGVEGTEAKKKYDEEENRAAVQAQNALSKSAIKRFDHDFENTREKVISDKISAIEEVNNTEVTKSYADYAKNVANKTSNYYKKFKDDPMYLPWDESKWAEIGAEFETNLQLLGEEEAVKELNNTIQREIANNQPALERAGYTLSGMVTTGVGETIALAGMLGATATPYALIEAVRNPESYKTGFINRYLDYMLTNPVASYGNKVAESGSFNIIGNGFEDFEKYGIAQNQILTSPEEDNMLFNYHLSGWLQLLQQSGFSAAPMGWGMAAAQLSRKFITKSATKLTKEALAKAGKATLAELTAEESAALASQIASTAKLSTAVDRAVLPLLFAVPEAGMAYNQVKDDVIKQGIQELDSYTTRAVEAKVEERMEKEHKKRGIPVKPAEIPTEVWQRKLQEDEEDLYESLFREEWDKLKPQYEDTRAQIEYAAMTGAMYDFLGYMAIQSVLNNTLQSFTMGPTIGERLATTKLGKIINPSTGRTITMNNGVYEVSSDFTPLTKAYYMLREPFSEGFLEEGPQTTLDEVNTKTALNNVKYFMERRYDPNALIQIGSHTGSEIHSAFQYGLESFTSKEAWNAAFMGAAGSAIGAFSLPQRTRSAQPKTQIARNADGTIKVGKDGKPIREVVRDASGNIVYEQTFKKGEDESALDYLRRVAPWRTGIGGAFNELHAMKQDAKYVDEQLQRVLNAEENKEALGALNSIFSWEQQVNLSATEKDRFSTMNSTLGKVVEMASVLEELEKTEKGATIAQQYKQQLQEVANLEANSEEAKKYVNSYRAKTKIANQSLSDEEIIKNIVSNAQQILNTIEESKSISEEIENTFGNINKDSKDALIFNRILVKNLEERQKKLEEEITGSIDASKKQEINNDIERKISSDVLQNKKYSSLLEKYGSIENIKKRIEAIENSLNVNDVDEKADQRRKERLNSELNELQTLVDEVTSTTNGEESSTLTIEDINNLNKSTRAQWYLAANSDIYETSHSTKKQQNKKELSQTEEGKKILEAQEKAKKELESMVSEKQKEVLSKVVQASNNPAEFLDKIVDSGRIEKLLNQLNLEYASALADPMMLNKLSQLAKRQAQKALYKEKHKNIFNSTSVEELNSRISEIQATANPEEMQALYENISDYIKNNPDSEFTKIYLQKEDNDKLITDLLGYIENNPQIDPNNKDTIYDIDNMINLLLYITQKFPQLSKMPTKEVCKLILEPAPSDASEEFKSLHDQIQNIMDDNDELAKFKEYTDKQDDLKNENDKLYLVNPEEAVVTTKQYLEIALESILAEERANPEINTTNVNQNNSSPSSQNETLNEKPEEHKNAEDEFSDRLHEETKLWNIALYTDEDVIDLMTLVKNKYSNQSLPKIPFKDLLQELSSYLGEDLAFLDEDRRHSLKTVIQNIVETVYKAEQAQQPENIFTSNALVNKERSFEERVVSQGNIIATENLNWLIEHMPEGSALIQYIKEHKIIEFLKNNNLHGQRLKAQLYYDKALSDRVKADIVKSGGTPVDENSLTLVFVLDVTGTENEDKAIYTETIEGTERKFLPIGILPVSDSNNFSGAIYGKNYRKEAIKHPNKLLRNSEGKIANFQIDKQKTSAQEQQSTETSLIEATVEGILNEEEKENLNSNNKNTRNAVLNTVKKFIIEHLTTRVVRGKSPIYLTIGEKSNHQREIECRILGINEWIDPVTNKNAITTAKEAVNSTDKHAAFYNFINLNSRLRRAAAVLNASKDKGGSLLSDISEALKNGLDNDDLILKDGQLDNGRFKNSLIKIVQNRLSDFNNYLHFPSKTIFDYINWSGVEINLVKKGNNYDVNLILKDVNGSYITTLPTIATFNPQSKAVTASNDIMFAGAFISTLMLDGNVDIEGNFTGNIASPYRESAEGSGHPFIKYQVSNKDIEDSKKQIAENKAPNDTFISPILDENIITISKKTVTPNQTGLILNISPEMVNSNINPKEIKETPEPLNNDNADSIKPGSTLETTIQNETVDTETLVNVNPIEEKPQSNIDTEPQMDQDTKKKIDQLIQSSNGINLSEDETHYEDKQHRKYVRTTSAIGKKFQSNSLSEQQEKDLEKIKLISSNIGTGVDIFCRDFFSGKLDGMSSKEIAEKYPNSSERNWEILRQQLQSLRDKWKNEGLTIVADGIKVFGDLECQDISGTKYSLPISGTLDIMLYDQQGNIYIYDMKTYHNTNTFTENSADSYVKQLAIYKKLIEAKGLKVKEVGLIPIKVTYNNPKNTNYFTKDGNKGTTLENQLYSSSVLSDNKEARMSGVSMALQKLSIKTQEEVDNVKLKYEDLSNEEKQIIEEAKGSSIENSIEQEVDIVEQKKPENTTDDNKLGVTDDSVYDVLGSLFTPIVTPSEKSEDTINPDTGSPMPKNYINENLTWGEWAGYKDSQGNTHSVEEIMEVLNARGITEAIWNSEDITDTQRKELLDCAFE